VRGVGEPPVIPVAATVANAIRDATGLRMTELPISAERLHRAMTARNGEGSTPANTAGGSGSSSISAIGLTPG
jgi:hypothetical protein